MRAIQIAEFGGPEVMCLVDVPSPRAEGDSAVVDVSSAGINYADTHQVEDTYLSRSVLPLIPGTEVVGALPDGQRVAGFTRSGAYAEQALVHPDESFAVPEGVSDGQALALLVQGLTAWHLLRTSTHLIPGESIVVHAAAGGVGSLAVQLAKAWGAGRIIGVASTEEKRALAESLGADATVDSRDPDLSGALQEANGGRVDVVLEMAGGDTFGRSLAALGPFGRIATFGAASGKGPRPVHPAVLMLRSQTVVGFWLANCSGRTEMLKPQMMELLAMVKAGSLLPQIGGVYPLPDAHRAHRALRNRSSSGKLILDCRT